MAIYVERTGIEACIKKIDAAIEELYSAAQSIDSAMNELPTYWQGTASNSAQATYAVDYKGLLTKTVPETVESFKKFINDCKETIIEVDNQLSGN